MNKSCTAADDFFLARQRQCALWLCSRPILY